MGISALQNHDSVMHAGVGNRRVPKEMRVAVRVALSLLVLSVPAFRGRHGWVDQGVGSHPWVDQGVGFIVVEIVLLLVLVATDTWMRTRTSAQRAACAAAHAAAHAAATKGPDGGAGGGGEGAAPHPRRQRGTLTIENWRRRELGYEAMQ